MVAKNRSYEERFFATSDLCALEAGGYLLSPRRSIIGANGLNFRVRNEIGCDPIAKPPTSKEQKTSGAGRVVVRSFAPHPHRQTTRTKGSIKVEGARMKLLDAGQRAVPSSRERHPNLNLPIVPHVFSQQVHYPLEPVISKGVSDIGKISGGLQDCVACLRQAVLAYRPHWEALIIIP